VTAKGMTEARIRKRNMDTLASQAPPHTQGLWLVECKEEWLLPYQRGAVITPHA
jgi:hypothetical protein